MKIGVVTLLSLIDASTRIARYGIQELGGYIYKPFGRLLSLPANLIASGLTVIA